MTIHLSVTCQSCHKDFGIWVKDENEIATAECPKCGQPYDTATGNALAVMIAAARKNHLENRDRK